MGHPIHISSALRRFVDGAAFVTVEANSPATALRELADRYPALAENIFLADGRLRSFVRVFVNEHDLRTLDAEALALQPGDSMTLIPAIAGG